MRLIGLALALGAALLHTSLAQAACPDAATVDTFIADRAAARPAMPPIAAGSSLDDGLCAQAMVVERLSKDLGPVVGYKAGLTSPPAQQAFGVDEPVFGTLLRDMLLKPGASVRAADAVRSLFEADLIVEIGDAAVNDATTPAEVLAAIRGVRPFLELPALVAPLDIQLDGPMITAINVGAWRGVMGDLIALPADETGVAMLADFTARLTDETTGETISAAKPSYKLQGYAYSGGGRKVTRVEVSLDQGQSWQLAEVTVREKPRWGKGVSGAWTTRGQGAWAGRGRRMVA